MLPFVGSWGFPPLLYRRLLGNCQSFFLFPYIFKAVVYSAAVIGLYASYALPILLRITSGRNKLVPGPFSLGKWSLPLGAIAVAWVVFIIILLLFPSFDSVTPQNMSRLYFSSMKMYRLDSNIFVA